ncbi:MAG: prolipoprotein diacylglyceryl transferase [Clostridia bacterium]|nr:prolipoprotein diacylglyceryl transferase [Clostridia bacterium]
MYPYELIEGTGIDLYVIAIIVGIVSAFVTLRILSDKVKLSDKVFNFVLVTSVVTIILGWLSAMLFQGFYNYLAEGVFVIRGQTFYGGLIGGAVVFILFYFGVGHFVFKDKANIRQFNELATIAAPSIVGAHAFGRIGCLMGGCCYGAITDKWYGIMMYSGGVWAKRVPTQLFESLFLFALAAVLVFLIIKFKNRNALSIYLVAYGVWRFIIEFVRADSERGSSGIPGLYPSQVTAIILVIVGVGWYFLYRFVLKDRMEKAGANEEKHV